jgi:hypothetical protein
MNSYTDYSYFPYCKILCIETYQRSKEIFNVKGKSSIIDTTNQQCSNYRYSIYLSSHFFKELNGNFIHHQYNCIGKVVCIQGFITNNNQNDYFEHYAIINDYSDNGFGNMILDVVSYHNLMYDNAVFDKCIYFDNSGIGHLNFINQFYMENYIDTDYLHDLYCLNVYNNQKYIFKSKSKMTDNVIECYQENTEETPNNTYEISGMYYVISNRIKIDIKNINQQNKISFIYLLHHFINNIIINLTDNKIDICFKNLYKIYDNNLFIGILEKIKFNNYTNNIDFSNIEFYVNHNQYISFDENNNDSNYYITIPLVF